MTHAHSRNGLNRGMVQWVVGAFLTGLITAVGFFAVTDRARIADDARDGLLRSMENSTEIRVLKAELKRLERIEKNQEEIMVLVRQHSRQ